MQAEKAKEVIEAYGEQSKEDLKCPHCLQPFDNRDRLVRHKLDFHPAKALSKGKLE